MTMTETIEKPYKPEQIDKIGKKKNLQLFKDLIGFTIKRKMQKLENTYKLGW